MVVKNLIHRGGGDFLMYFNSLVGMTMVEKIR